MDVINYLKLFCIKVFTATAALAGASQISPNYGNVGGKVVNNEILRANRRIFSGSGGWGGGGGGGDSVVYRAGPPQLDNSGFMSLFNAMSGFGLSSNYGAPASGGSSGGGGSGSGGRPSSQYGPPGSSGGRPSGSGSGGGRPPSSQYGPPSSQYGPPGSGSSGSGGGRPSSQYGPPAGGSGANTNAGALPVVLTRSRGNGGGAGGRGASGSGGGAGVGVDGGRIFRYVSLFTAPEESAPTRTKIVRAGTMTPDKHVNIIFVKPPTPPGEQPTEVMRKIFEFFRKQKLKY